MVLGHTDTGLRRRTGRILIVAALSGNEELVPEEVPPRFLGDKELLRLAARCQTPCCPHMEVSHASPQGILKLP
jgi:hypothetical protein